MLRSVKFIMLILLIILLFLNKIGSQLSSRSYVARSEPLRKISKTEVPFIKPATSWLVERHTDHSVNEAVNPQLIFLNNLKIPMKILLKIYFNNLIVKILLFSIELYKLIMRSSAI